MQTISEMQRLSTAEKSGRKLAHKLGRSPVQATSYKLQAVQICYNPRRYRFNATGYSAF